MDDRLDSTVAALEEWGARRNRMLDTYFRGALRERYERLRAAAALDTSSLDRYQAAADVLRTRLIDEGLGGWPARPSTIGARETQIAELEPGNLYRVHVEVLPGVEMMALLLVPHAAATRAAPAVICQHGYGGSPEWAMGFGTPGVSNYMNGCGHRLAAAGYVVLAPHIVCSPPGVGEDRVWLDRLARMGNRSLLGFEMFEFSRMIDFLQTRPEVLPERIGMYGISQGGMSTLFAAACDTRIRAAVCSCYFNDRWRKLFEPEHLRRQGGGGGPRLRRVPVRHRGRQVQSVGGAAVARQRTGLADLSAPLHGRGRSLRFGDRLARCGCRVRPGAADLRPARRRRARRGQRRRVGRP